MNNKQIAFLIGFIAFVLIFSLLKAPTEYCFGCSILFGIYLLLSDPSKTVTIKGENLRAIMRRTFNSENKVSE
jgi:hypothetical protein